VVEDALPRRRVGALEEREERLGVEKVDDALGRHVVEARLLQPVGPPLGEDGSQRLSGNGEQL
jgi:hypothetical protein